MNRACEQPLSCLAPPLALVREVPNRNQTFASEGIHVLLWRVS